MQPTQSTGGTKHDSGKTPLDLVPIDVIIAIGEVLAFGAKKYAPWNWVKGFKWSRLYAAAMRHLTSFMSGEDLDPETGLSHLAHCLCMVGFLYVHQLRKLGEDDRHVWPKLEQRPAEPPPASKTESPDFDFQCGCGHANSVHTIHGCTSIRFLVDAPQGVPCICKQQRIRRES